MLLFSKFDTFSRKKFELTAGTSNFSGDSSGFLYELLNL